MLSSHRKTALILRLSLAANLLALAVAGLYIARQGGLDYLRQKTGLAPAVRHVDTPLYRGRADTLAQLPAPNGRWVFLGDSMTDHAPLDELFVEATANRGLASDRIGDIAARLPALRGSRPAGIVVWAGLNDLLAGHNCARVADDLLQLLRELQREFAGTPLAVIEIAALNEAANPAASQLNAAIRCSNERLQVGLDDIPLLRLAALNEKGALRSAYTMDGVHFNGSGYRAWAGLIAPRLGLALRPGVTAP